jgi:hypothetical protein
MFVQYVQPMRSPSMVHQPLQGAMPQVPNQRMQTMQVFDQLAQCSKQLSHLNGVSAHTGNEVDSRLAHGRQTPNVEELLRYGALLDQMQRASGAAGHADNAGGATTQELEYLTKSISALSRQLSRFEMQMQTRAA